MSFDIYRSPEGAAEAKFPPEQRKVKIPDQYLAAIDKGLKEEIGWIVGEIPEYQSEKILNGPNVGGEYYSLSGQIVVNDTDLRINYPHEKLHWLSRHKQRRVRVFSQVFERVLTGSKVELPGTKEESLRWLSEAIVSETTQKVLAHSNIVRFPLVKYSEDLGGPIAKYVAGWENAGVRRVGDFFKNSEYSKLYGELFRPLVIRMGGFLRTTEGRDIYNSFRQKHKLPIYSSAATDTELCSIAIKIFQVGEFSFDNSAMYKILDKMLGRGKLKQLVEISKSYDTLASMKLAGNRMLHEDELVETKAALLELIKG